MKINLLISKGYICVFLLLLLIKVEKVLNRFINKVGIWYDIDL